jgi:DhnA family fructose-bisphosphate aldolase class Ia
LRRIFSHDSSRAVIVPLDDSLLSGPKNGLESIKPKLTEIVGAEPDGIIGFQGLFTRFGDLVKNLPGVLNLTASTTLGSHTRKVLVGTVELALRLGLDAVAVHVNISSRYEPEMISNLSRVIQKCTEFDVPVIGIMYPRRENEDDTDDNYEGLKTTDHSAYVNMVAHAARIGMELGADVIKTQYTGDPDSFAKVVEACSPIPVIIAGGPVMAPLKMLEVAAGAVCAGGGGVSFGRNIFSRKNPKPYITALKKVVLEKVAPEEANESIICSAE